MSRSRNVVKKSMTVSAVGLFLVSAALTGCDSGSDNAPASSEPTGSGANTGESQNAGTVDHSKPITITVFDNAANYQGEQTGWYGKLVKDKFNITLNILAPQVAGDQLYKTRTAAGDLGDLLIVDNSQLEELIPAGLVMDMTDKLKNTKYLSQYVDNHFKPFNAAFDKVNPEGKIYGLPTFEADTSPTTFSEEIPYSSPIMPWDYYKGVGAPKLNDLNDLLNVLKQMQAKYPKTPDGKPIVPITLWKDWDGGSMENVRWLGNWYGYEQPDGTSTIQLNAKGDIVPLVDDNSMYKKILQFYFNANQMGLVDPDAPTQDWNKVAEKLTNKQVLLLWYSWQRGFYNSIERGKEGDGNVAVPIADSRIIQSSDAYYGNGRVFAIGAKAKNSDRIMEFMDWLASPEGLRYYTNGFEGFNYEKTADGKFKLTEVGQTAFQKNTPVPAEYGGGGYQDGQSKINSMIMSDFVIDPDTKEFYNSNYWSATIEANKTALTTDWQKAYGAENATDYYLKNNMIDVVPNINTSLGTDSSDIKNKRSQISDYVKNTSWKMVFAKNQAEFDQLWAKLQKDVDGLGWKDVVSADTAKAQKIVKMRADALAGK
ncbi:sugar ABC transporter substrate-binding protein [Paenibacillus sacheonensis]|uniref:Sugar ABC transporter substrate-binding protein n=1 Tax=Paenibacillus sacheonensis TaxID=742054 RepID=A0A7X4YM53_9BACL|nr:sugar ABC transporter substrate-binding protein [Paenibacillus sacheonensis]MBM7565836.1 putative aldouronate transport system substrate-binding protein [Paenibacillus sacheonensis]NBC68845.1 sugar ABC transporter substrate-binding protein [Paenibacillus sacheonensis]